MAAFEDALDLEPEARTAFLKDEFGDDQAAIDQVMALIKADSIAPSAMPTELPGADGNTILVAPERIGPYKLEAVLGAGGMGEVWLGQRDDGLFEQQVAIKLMRPSRFAAESLSFFDTERRALARLNHRHIARLFDGGVTEEGLPWFVMELIDGLPLNIYAARGLTREASIRLAAAIAEAAQYAHSQLVVHADLKPSNILIKHTGEPVLVDFGIASMAAAAAEQVQKTAFPSTPAYASPERLQGAQPTVADDVFGLGLLLHGLLTGKWPEKPVTLPLATTGDARCDAIIARACATEAANRYATAQGLADDLHALLEDRPTSLEQGEWRTESRLFVKRHPRGVAAAATALAGVILALGVIATLYVRAEHERSLAQARFNDVREMANYMLGDFHEDLIKLPGSTGLRERNATVGWQYLTRLSKDPKASDDITRDIAVGYSRLGNAQATTSSNGSGKVNQGDWALQKSETLLRGLIAKHPDRDDYKRELARTLSWRSGVLLGAHNDPKAARAALDESFRLFDEVLQRNPKDLDAAYGRWNAALGLGDLYFGADDMPALKTLMEQTLARFRDTPATSKNRSLHALLEAGTENNLGDSSYYVVSPAAGIAHYRRAEALMAQARAEGVTDMRLPLRQAYYNYQLSSSFADQNQPQLALQWADKGLAIINELAEFDDSAATLHTLDILTTQRALALSQLGRAGEAVAAARGSIARRRLQLTHQPDDMDNRVNLAAGLHNLAKLYVASGDRRQACAAAWESLAIFDYINGHGGIPERNKKLNVAPELAFVAKCPADTSVGKR